MVQVVLNGTPAKFSRMDENATIVYQMYIQYEDYGYGLASLS
jgi:hypothetical protein